MRTLLVVPALLCAAAGFACTDGSSDGTDLPDGIPTYTDAEAQPDSTFSEDDAFIGSWRTSDDVADVRAYFEATLEDGGWRVVESREITDGVLIRIEDADDSEHGGTIIIHEEDDGARIVKMIGRGGGASDDGDDDDGAGGTGELPDGYPDDVPLPDGAAIVSGSAPLVGETQYYLVDFSTQSEPADVIAYFNQALPAQGWRIGAAEDNPDAFALNYSREGARVLITGGHGGSGTKASVAIVIGG